MDNSQLITFENSTLSGNHSADHGGAAYSQDSGAETYFFNSTIVQNVADADNDGMGDGGGVYIEFGTIHIESSILAENQDLGGEEPGCAGTSISSLGFNLRQNCDATGSQETDLVDISPLLGPLRDNGGPTLTHMHESSSPVLDAGNPYGCRDQVAVPIELDQRGVLRVMDGDHDGVARCDIGAVERRTLMPLEGAYCQTVGDDIPDLGFALGTIAIQDSILPSDINVRLVVDHPRVGDLVVELWRNGEIVTLLDEPQGLSGACTGPGAAMIFSDEANGDAAQSCADAGAAYLPGGYYSVDMNASTLSAFDGQDAYGAWNLAVMDLTAGQTGRLLGWCLEFEDDIFVDGFESGDFSAWSSFSR